MSKFRDKTGLLQKVLCCNCLGENFVVIPLKAEIKCLNCGSINDPQIRLWISYIPETVGNEF